MTTNQPQPGTSYRVHVDGGPTAEIIYWGETADGRPVVTWAIRGTQDFKASEGPKPSGVLVMTAQSKGTLTEGQRYRYRAADEFGHGGSLVIGEATGVYQPRDEKANGIDIMAEAYHRQVEVAESASGLTLRAENLAQSAGLVRARRDDMVRDMLVAGVSAIEAGRRAGLSRERVYQIRDGRR